MKTSKLNSFLTYLVVGAFIASIIAIPILTGCQKEECFKSKHVTGEVVATLKNVATHGKT